MWRKVLKNKKPPRKVGSKGRKKITSEMEEENSKRHPSEQLDEEYYKEGRAS